MPHDEVFDQLAGRDRELLRSGQSEPPHSNGDLRGDPARIDHVYDGLVREGLRGVGQLLACAEEDLVFLRDREVGGDGPGDKLEVGLAADVHQKCLLFVVANVDIHEARGTALRLLESRLHVALHA